MIPVSDETLDLNLFQGLEARGEHQITLAFGGETGGQGIYGVQKAVQQFTLLFLTEKGSSFYDPNFGTDFMTMLRQGRVRNDADVSLQFGLAAAEILDYLADTDAPDDETLVDIVLDWFILQHPQLILGVTVTTAAGTIRETVLPVTAEA